MYSHKLSMSLVENVLNVYGIMVIIIISIICVAFSLLHHWSIEEHKFSENKIKTVPREIIILFMVIFVCTVIPFLR